MQAIRWSPASSKQIEQWLAVPTRDAEQEEICRLYQQVNSLINKMAELDKQVMMNIIGKRDALAEKLKEKNQMEWVQRIGNIQARAREIVCDKLIFN